MPFSLYGSAMASSSDEDAHDDEIRLWREDDWWVAKDVETDVTTQGPSRDAALANLDEAVAPYHGILAESRQTWTAGNSGSTLRTTIPANSMTWSCSRSDSHWL